MAGEIEEGWEVLHRATWVTGIRESRSGVSELIEEGVNHSINRRESLSRGVLQEARDKIDCVLISLAENLVERVWLDLGKFMLHVVRVHGADLIASWGTKNLDNLDKLIDTRLSGEQRLT